MHLLLPSMHSKAEWLSIICATLNICPCFSGVKIFSVTIATNEFPNLNNICLSFNICILHKKRSQREVNVIIIKICIYVSLSNVISFKAMAINSFIHSLMALGSCVWPLRKTRPTVSVKYLEELPFSEMISHLELLCLMMWILFLGLEQIWDLLHWNATMNSYELSFSSFYLWQKNCP